MGVIADLRWLERDPRFAHERGFIDRLLKFDLYLRKQCKVLLELRAKGKFRDAGRLIGEMHNEATFIRNKLLALSQMPGLNAKEANILRDAENRLAAAMNDISGAAMPGDEKESIRDIEKALSEIS